MPASSSLRAAAALYIPSMPPHSCTEQAPGKLRPGVHVRPVREPDGDVRDQAQVLPWTEAVVNVHHSREENPTWLPDMSLPASDVVLHGNNWKTIGFAPCHILPGSWKTWNFTLASYRALMSLSRYCWSVKEALDDVNCPLRCNNFFFKRSQDVYIKRRKGYDIHLVCSRSLTCKTFQYISGSILDMLNGDQSWVCNVLDS